MRERPIIFSGPMVRAILDGTKTQTRRVVKRRWLQLVEECLRVNGRWVWSTFDFELTTPYGQPGDRLWVRETFQYESKTEDFEWDVKNCVIRYRATEPDAGPWVNAEDVESSAWRPSIHMPRWASRLTLEVTGVRVERVQDIGRADAKAEGFLPGANGLESWGGQCYGNAQLAYRACWDSLNDKRGHGWDVNPWVWVIEFKRILLETETLQ